MKKISAILIISVFLLSFVSAAAKLDIASVSLEEPGDGVVEGKDHISIKAAITNSGDEDLTVPFYVETLVNGLRYSYCGGQCELMDNIPVSNGLKAGQKGLIYWAGGAYDREFLKEGSNKITFIAATEDGSQNIEKSIEFEILEGDLAEVDLGVKDVDIGISGGKLSYVTIILYNNGPSTIEDDTISVGFSLTKDNQNYGSYGWFLDLRKEYCGSESASCYTFKHGELKKTQKNDLESLNKRLTEGKYTLKAYLEDMNGLQKYTEKNQENNFFTKSFKLQKACVSGDDCEAVFSHCSCSWTCALKTDEPRIDCARACPAGEEVPKPECGCVDGKCVPKSETCQKVCKYIGSKSEGWYDSCTGKLIEYASCGAAPECKDSDNGLNYFEAGKAYGSDGYGTIDACDFFTSTKGILWEAICENGKAAHYKTKCPEEAPYCNRGVCSAEPGKCTDTDNGLNYGVKGAITEPRLAEGPQHMDYCENLKTLQPWYNWDCEGDDCPVCKGELCGLREYYCTDPYTTTTYRDVACPEGCKDGACLGNIGCEAGPCDDGTVPECKIDNGVCICSTCPPIVVKPVCGNGICETGEGEVCTAVLEKMIYCEEGKECKVPGSECGVVCPEDCETSDIIQGIYSNINEKFKLSVNQPVKIMENGQAIMKITFKNLLVSKCGEVDVDKEAKERIQSRVIKATGNFVAETETSSGSVANAAVSSIYKCVGSKPKALLNIEKIKESELSSSDVLNLELGEKKQIDDITISFLDYDYASRTGLFLTARETFSCKKGCKCDDTGNVIECIEESCKKGETLCPDGICRKRCEITEEDCTFGCYYEGKCFPMGIRSNGLYCSDDLIMTAQKNSDEACENSFECASNVCVSGKCVSEGLIKKLLNWLLNLVG